MALLKALCYLLWPFETSEVGLFLVTDTGIIRTVGRLHHGFSDSRFATSISACAILVFKALAASGVQE